MASVTAAVVAAAGRGERLGPGAPKALRLLAGEPLLVHAVRALAAAPSIRLIVVAAPPSNEAAVKSWLEPLVSAAATDLAVVTGGATRQASVRTALDALPPPVDVVLIHDAARALAPVSLVEAVAREVRQGADAVIPGLPLADTVKQVAPDGTVIGTLDRDRLRAIQTPQGFRREVLQRAHADTGAEIATDDAGLVERIGVPVRVIPGSAAAFKVTTPFDLTVAEALLATRSVTGNVPT